MIPRKVRCYVNALLFGLMLLATPLSAAIVQTGNVFPNINTWTSSTTGYIGNTSDGSVTVDGGSTLASEKGFLGYQSNSTGMATVTGTGSKWTNSSWLYIGLFGNGTLIIEAGGQVSNAYHGYLGHYVGSTGMVTVTGQGSIWTNVGDLNVGDSGNGTLTIEAGGQVSSAFGFVGSSHGLTSTVTVSGAGSKWTNRSGLAVGGVGNSTLTIEAGGQVSSSGGFLGRGRPGTTGAATVTGVGSTWFNDGELIVGDSRSGMLTIEAGAQVNSIVGYLGYQSYSTGLATVTGQGSQWFNAGGLEVGRLGKGTLIIEAGGLVSVGGTLRIDFDSDGDSIINMSTGGMLALYGDADDSLSQFLGLVQGTDAIRYWNASLSDWAPLTSATYGDDYTLRYLTEGDLAGYTLLTVGTAVPEPATWLLACGLVMIGCVARRYERS